MIIQFSMIIELQPCDTHKIYIEINLMTSIHNYLMT